MCLQAVTQKPKPLGTIRSPFIILFIIPIRKILTLPKTNLPLLLSPIKEKLNLWEKAISSHSLNNQKQNMSLYLLSGIGQELWVAVLPISVFILKKSPWWKEEPQGPFLQIQILLVNFVRTLKRCFKRCCFAASTHLKQAGLLICQKKFLRL